jgi:ribosomal protein S2
MTPNPVILPFGEFDPELVTIKVFVHEKQGVVPEVYAIPLSDLLAQAAGSAVGNGANTGEAVLVAGTVTVANTNITSTSLIFLTRRVLGGAVGNLSYVRNAGVSFVINSTSNTETSTVSYFILY